jgi:LacI family transcriptional regulator
MDGEGIAVVFANSDWEGRREKAFLRMASRNRFDGVLINPIATDNDELRALAIPIVLIGSRLDFPDFDTVGSDSYGATCQALDYLSSLGHRRIGLIRGRGKSRPGYSRLRGYLDYGREHGLPLDESSVVQVNFDFEGGRRGLHRLLALPEPPTAILAANDILALGALQAAHELQVDVPGTLSIVGMDDIFAAATTTPPLTTMAKPKYEIGRKAAGMLLERIGQRRQASSRRRLLSCTLQERGSTGPAP